MQSDFERLNGGQVDALLEDGLGLLHVAAAGGRVSVVKELLARGACVDLLTKDTRHTALFAAASKGEHAIVRLLLEHKAGVDHQGSNGWTALMGAGHESHTECVQTLLAAGANTTLRDKDGYTALEKAEASGHAATAKLLQQHAATPLAFRYSRDGPLTGRRVRIDGAKRPELNGRFGMAMRLRPAGCHAAGCYVVKVEGEVVVPGGARVEGVEILLKPSSLQVMETGPASKRQQQVPVHISRSAYAGEPKPVVEWLHEAGHIDALDEHGQGLLHVAAMAGRVSLAKELLARGACVDLLIKDTGEAALVVAAHHGEHAMVRLLLEHKASVDHQGFDGATALMEAAVKGRLACVQALLEAGASSTLRNAHGRTALELAETYEHAATAELLRVAAEAAAQRAAAELLAEVKAEVVSKAMAGKKKTKNKCGGAASSAASKAASLEPMRAAAPPTAESRGAAPSPSARELAMAALQHAIDADELEPLRKAISTHAAAADGASVLKAARTLRDRLAEQQRKKEKLAARREQKRREEEKRAAEAETEASVWAAEHRAAAEAQAAAEERLAAEQAAAEQAAAEQAAAEQAAAEQAAAERVAVEEKERRAAERAAARQVEEETQLAETLARSMASLQADEERRLAAAVPRAIPMEQLAVECGAGSSRVGRVGANEVTHIPDEYVCPITCEVMTDPVVTADGFTYERSAISTWLENHNTSPKTGALLESKHLFPNQSLRIMILKFQE